MRIWKWIGFILFSPILIPVSLAMAGVDKLLELEGH